VLVPQEVAALFANLRELKQQGHTLVFISHKLDEVLEIADDITVLRRGTTVATVRPADVTAAASPSSWWARSCPARARVSPR
jgi:simple sugar transport system ATP-binding protein